MNGSNKTNRILGRLTDANSIKKDEANIGNTTFFSPDATMVSFDTNDKTKFGNSIISNTRAIMPY